MIIKMTTHIYADDYVYKITNQSIAIMIPQLHPCTTMTIPYVEELLDLTMIPHPKLISKKNNEFIFEIMPGSGVHSNANSTKTVFVPSEDLIIRCENICDSFRQIQDNSIIVI